jgi:hypothetical protein
MDICKTPEKETSLKEVNEVKKKVYWLRKYFISYKDLGFSMNFFSLYLEIHKSFGMNKNVVFKKRLKLSFY